MIEQKVNGFIKKYGHLIDFFPYDLFNTKEWKEEDGTIFVKLLCEERVDIKWYHKLFGLERRCKEIWVHEDDISFVKVEYFTCSREEKHIDTVA